MAVAGWSVDLSTGSYKTPGTCASCMGPNETQVKATATEKVGNVRRTLTMHFPYCQACARRVASEHTRGILVGVVAALVGVAAPAVAWFAEDRIDPAIGMTAAFAAVALFGVGLAYATRPALPEAPATARGEAVMLLGTYGKVLCTNEQFASLLARANNLTPKPDKKWMTVEMWAPLVGVLVAFFVFACWLKTPSRPSPPAYSPPVNAAAAPPIPRPQPPVHQNIKTPAKR